MNFLIGLAAKVVGERFAPALAYAVVIGAIWAAIVWLRADARADTDAKWIAAGKTLEVKAAKAAGSAEAASVKRIAAENERVRDEKEKLDAAQADGSSPIDVLFGA